MGVCNVVGLKVSGNIARSGSNIMIELFWLHVRDYDKVGVDGTSVVSSQDFVTAVELPQETSLTPVKS
jgi:hypothetical protein